MIGGWVVTGVFLGHHFVHEELLIRVVPGAAKKVDDGGVSQQFDRSSVDRHVKHGRSPIRVRQQEPLKYIENDERAEADREQDGHDGPEDHADEDVVEDKGVLPVDRECGPRVELIECEQRLLLGRLLGLEGVLDAACPLVNCSEEPAQGPETHELEQGVVHVENHGTADHQAHIVEPVCVQVGIEAPEKLLDEFQLGLSAVPSGKHVNEAVVEERHEEDGKHDHVRLLGQVREPELFSDPEHRFADNESVDCDEVRETHRPEGYRRC